jgi:hypothetical protein
MGSEKQFSVPVTVLVLRTKYYKLISLTENICM